MAQFLFDCIIFVNILLSLDFINGAVVQVSNPFDPYRLECPHKFAVIKLTLQRVDSIGKARNDTLVASFCENIAKLYPSDRDDISPADVSKDVKIMRWTVSDFIYTLLYLKFSNYFLDVKVLCIQISYVKLSTCKAFRTKIVVGQPRQKSLDRISVLTKFVVNENSLLALVVRKCYSNDINQVTLELNVCQYFIDVFRYGFLCCKLKDRKRTKCFANRYTLPTSDNPEIAVERNQLLLSSLAYQQVADCTSYCTFVKTDSHFRDEHLIAQFCDYAVMNQGTVHTFHVIAHSICLSCSTLQYTVVC